MEQKVFISKQDLRSRYLIYRNGLSISERKEKSFKIWELLKKEPFYQKAQAILVYMDYRSEVMTTGLVEELLSAGEKRVFAPRVEGMDIQFYEVSSMDDFADGYQGIREPEINPDKLFTVQTAKKMESILLVPGAVFDRERGRMGYGKGFYDRYLSLFSQENHEGGELHFHSAALAFACQIAKKVPMESHDRKPDIIVTDTGIIR